MPQPYEIRLVFDPVKTPAGYMARWIDADNPESKPFELALPLTAADMLDLRWYLETYVQLPGAGDRTRAAGIEAKLDAWGRRLFDACFGTAEGKEVERNLGDAVRDGQPALLTIGATDPDVLGQPWEMMRDKRGVLAMQGVTIRRQLQGAGRRQSLRLGLPLRVLLIVSRPEDIGFIDPRTSALPVLNALDALPAGEVVVDFCDPPTLPELERRISQARKDRQPYHIVHFDGHGTYLPLTGVGALAFEDDRAKTELVPGRQLGDLLARLEVPVVLLEACRSADLSDRPVFGSVAPALLEAGVGSVVAFSHAVHVEAARILVQRFYQELVGGRTVGQALEEARAALRARPARWLHLGPDAETVDLQDWFVPQLYQVGADVGLVENPLPRPLPPGGGGESREASGLAGIHPLPRPLPLEGGGGSGEAGGLAGIHPLPRPLPLEGGGEWREAGGLVGIHPLPRPLPLEGGGGRGREKLVGFPPPPMYRFHGRAMELLALERAFRRHNAVVLHAMGGMGKTALAREAAAWWLRTGRFEAAVFHSFEQKAGAERVVQLLGQALEGDDFTRRPGDDQWRAAVDLFHTHRVLLVWDNFESTLPAFQAGEDALTPSPTPSPLPLPGTSRGENVSSGRGEGAGGRGEGPTAFSPDSRARLLQLYRDLTAGQPAGRLLVTCRPADTGLPAIKELPLAGLKRPDSLHLLAAIADLKSIDLARAGYGRPEIDALLDLLDDHPLSVELVAPHLKTLTPKEIRDDFGRHLARFAEGSAFESRNRSLLASLAFSTRRLSAAAQAVLPLLAWFEGGVFEQFFLDFSDLTPDTWHLTRSELEATALISAEDDFEINDRPFLRFHPTLPYAAPRAAGDGLDERFIAVYLAVRQAADNALRGRQPAAGMALVALEEANLRRAMALAFGRGDRQQGWAIAGTLGVYLERAGRLRERDSLTAWVQAQMPADGALDEAACAAIRQDAWSQFTQGRAAEAVQAVQALIARLEAEGLAGGADPTFQIAMSYRYLGQIYVDAHRPDLALATAQRAIAMFEQLGDAQRGNLAAALGDLANAYRQLGRFDEALAVSDRGLAIRRELGHTREVAAGLGRSADILAQQQRYVEADARYAEALAAARAAGDLGLQGTLLQHQGNLQRKQGHHDRAVDLFKQAIALFQRAGSTGDEMRTCDQLASAEMLRGHLDAAGAWYARSRELALQLDDRAQLAATAQNLGILYQTRAEQAASPAARTALLRQAVASVKESLAIELERNNQIGAAESHGQLGKLHRLLGELDQAEQYMRQALQIHESLNLPDVYKVYGNLALIARERGDLAAAAQWQAKYEAKVRELERLRKGEGGEGGRRKEERSPGAERSGGGREEAEVAQVILALARAAYRAWDAGTALAPDAAEVMAQLAQMPPPWDGVAALLQAVAAGQPAPPVPAGLPREVAEVLQTLRDTVAG